MDGRNEVTDVEGEIQDVEREREAVRMNMMANQLQKMAEFAANPELVAEKMEEMEQLIEKATAWLENPIDVPEGIQEIEKAGRALSMYLAVQTFPWGEASSQFCNALNCIASEAISRAYLKGRKDAMAEMVLCGECPDETK